MRDMIDVWISCRNLKNGIGSRELTSSTLNMVRREREREREREKKKG